MRTIGENQQPAPVPLVTYKMLNMTCAAIVILVAAFSLTFPEKGTLGAIIAGQCAVIPLAIEVVRRANIPSAFNACWAICSFCLVALIMAPVMGWFFRMAGTIITGATERLL